jgi:cytochrome c oxidase assembly protein subunit 11
MSDMRPQRQAAYLVLLAAGMFGFAFALVPLYEVFCEITGLNGKTGSEPAALVGTADVSDREVTVQFTAMVARGMPWEFRPTENKLDVKLGEIHTTEFYVRNRANRDISGQAVPSVAPGYAARHLNKIECFCFTQQHLAADGEMLMPLQFFVSTDLPDEVNTLSLSYTMFLVDDGAPVAAAVIPDHDSHAHEESAGP